MKQSMITATTRRNPIVRLLPSVPQDGRMTSHRARRPTSCLSLVGRKRMRGLRNSGTPPLLRFRFAA